MEDKEKAYNTVALKYYELEELREIKADLLTMEQDYKAKVIVKSIHSSNLSMSHYFFKKKSFDVAPELLIQIIDELIKNKQEYLDKAIDLTLALENK